MVKKEELNKSDTVKRVYDEKKEPFAVMANSILNDIQLTLQIFGVIKVRLINRYDVENIEDEDFEKAIDVVFSEPSVDITYRELPEPKITDKYIVVEPLPGQFDQRADSCAQCIQLLTTKQRPRVKTAKIYILSGYVDDSELDVIKQYLINPVEAFEGSLKLPKTLNADYDIPTEVESIEEFTEFNTEELSEMIDDLGLAMDLDDLKITQDYFKKENRIPTITEIRVLDTYWSDHCRHTTFLTQLENVKIDNPQIQETYNLYLKTREELNIKKPVCLMDLATVAAKKLKKDGLLEGLDESEEINACSVKISVDVNDTEEEWLLMFKNETHNHPTEIEPFGGAATCLGGAIRDPLSGRSYVYQAMRITGAANPLLPLTETAEGKLPQRKICITAANGYSSYGNQIGLATGLVNEIYHPDYVAKRMEIGAVIGAAPAENVRRERPVKGDLIILLGGKTGRDGCGGATGSSKAHSTESLETCGAEVQKGNPPEERKIQRLFRNKDVTSMIKRCNDFGAGGVSVAIGELADSLTIYLDKVPKKYDGLDGTELAISESQERMAVVVAANDTERFIQTANKENLEATVVAEVTDNNTLKMIWNDKTIVNLSRDFLNSNGAPKFANATVAPVKQIERDSIYTGRGDFSEEEQWEQMLSSLNSCSQKGLIERFDSTIGASSVFAPFGGIYQSTPAQSMVAKIPVLKGETNSVSIMSYGFNPFITEKDPYKGAILAVVESVAKIVSAGGKYSKCYLTFQEYFERLNDDPTRWGKPLAALLGAFKAQLELGIASIGGKDSMSGSFEDMDVPPTLVSFAVSKTNECFITDNVFHTIHSNVIFIKPEYDENGLPVWASLKNTFEYVEKLVDTGRARSISAITNDGIAGVIAKMSFGNRIGFKFCKKIDLFKPYYGGFVIELIGKPQENEEVIGHTTLEYVITTGEYIIKSQELHNKWEETLEPVYPTTAQHIDEKIPSFRHFAKKRAVCTEKFAKPRVLIPVFPGTNCEYDTERAFEKAGAVVETVVIKNLTSADVIESVKLVEEKLKNSQILMLSGGFSGGDEPEGSAKLIAAFFRNAALTEQVRELLNTRKGLILGICNGFQALIKLGLVPFGDIVTLDKNSPTLTFNSIARHQSLYVRTCVSSNISPWLYNCNVGDIHTIPVSHGEGRFIANADMLKELAENHQVATQYVNINSEPTYDIRYNPNNSVCAIEGITSKDGRVFGKMAHSERFSEGIGKNISLLQQQPIFLNGVKYFS
ncbi:MAG: phosphoribosylformylglycinamidine synthase [Oscillospiraceae bacterium]|jgi:phosphoribosylformylglycinamidine synthase|nr:phosphoribosylformylglycinamidine synthase [Oscillospiraceae bacterium]